MSKKIKFLQETVEGAKVYICMSVKNAIYGMHISNVKKVWNIIKI